MRTSPVALILCLGISLVCHLAFAYWPHSGLASRAMVTASAQATPGIEIDLNFQPPAIANTDNEANHPVAHANQAVSQKPAVKEAQEDRLKTSVNKPAQEISEPAKVSDSEPAIKEAEAVEHKLSRVEARKPAAENRQESDSVAVVKLEQPEHNTSTVASDQRANTTIQQPDLDQSKQQSLKDSPRDRSPTAAAEVAKTEQVTQDTLEHTSAAEVASLDNSEAQKLRESNSQSRPVSMRYQMGSPSTPKPRYPIIAVKRGWQGKVVIAMQVLSDGTPAQVSVKKGSGFPVLDKTALKQLSRWRLAPSSSPLETIYIPVIFKL